jgi:hypothetical protein
MLYNVLISSLTVLGIVGLFVYSRKLSRSHVYPVGIVRKHPQVGAPDEAIEAVIEDDFSSVAAQEVFAGLALERVLQCPKCGLVQESGADNHCRRCKHDLVNLMDVIGIETEELESKDSAQRVMMAKVVGHDKTLDSHQMTLRHLEKRIRQLELESVQRLDKPESPERLRPIDDRISKAHKELIN